MSSNRRFQNDLAALSNLDDPVRRRLYQYVASEDRPVGRDEAAAAAHIGRTLAAYHLDKLAEHELLSVSYERLGKRRGQGGGRPAKLYSRPPRELTVSVPPRDYLLRAWRLHFRDVRHSLESAFYHGWDLHPAQLVTRYVAAYEFFRECTESTAVGTVLEDPAARGVRVNLIQLGLDCGAIGEAEARAALS